MPWFRVDDGFHSHPKRLSVSLAAVGLWTVAGSWSSAHLTDGAVPDYVLPLLSADSPTLSRELVAAGLWERRRGGYVFHDWAEKNPSKVEVKNERKKNARRQALYRDNDLKEQIRARDGDGCRYCGIRVRWGKGQAPDSGTYDHVDPDGPNSLGNLVIACVACNSRKCDRTPRQAGMTLRNPPSREAYTEAYTEASANGSREASPTQPIEPPW